VGDARRPAANAADILADLAGSGRRDEAVESFMREMVGLPEEFIAGMKQSPFWDAQVKIAHTLEYDARAIGDYSIPAEPFGTWRRESPT
ncbi:MAG: alpha/beta hydrolase, partial [Chloroflexi bacterium]|nr:alpha/beta hydrolase [Chloroflexota bacterium]